MFDNNLLRCTLKDRRFFIFDFETSCLNLVLPYNMPWQVGHAIAEGYNVVEEKETILKWPNYYISPDAARICHFHPSIMEQKGVDPREALEMFDKELYNTDNIIVGTNLLGFDIYIHNMWRHEMGKPTDYSYLNRLIDLQSLAKAFKLQKTFNLEEDFLPQQYRLLNFRQKGLKTNLGQLCQDFGIEFDANIAHDATYDVVKTFEAFQKLVKALNI